MNTKAIAMALAALMVVSCVGLALADDTSYAASESITDAEDIGTITIVKPDSGTSTATAELTVNETAYTTTATDNAVGFSNVWAAALMTSGSADFDGKTSVTFTQDTTGDSTSKELTSYGATDGPGLSLKRTTLGEYELTVTVDQNTATTSASNQYNIAIKSTISVTKGSGSLALTPVYFKVTVNVIDTGIEIAIDDVTLNKGDTANSDIKTGTNVPVGSIWYATGEFPAGLSLSSDGRVVGTALGDSTTNDAITVYAEDSYGNIYIGKFDITINGDSTSVEKEYTVNVTGAEKSGDDYLAITDDPDIKVTVKESSTTVTTGVSITVIDDSGIKTLKSGTDDSSGEFTIPASGTGAYYVSVYVDGSLVKEFKLYVFGAPANSVQAGIAISTGSP